MANTTKFGEIETMIRRDIVNDNDETQYRWSSFQVMSAINRAIVDLVNRYNVWAGYNPITGARLTNLDTSAVSRYCDADPTTLSAYDETTSFIDGETSYTGVTAFIAHLRDKTIPISDRYRNSIAYLGAAKLLETDNSDTANAQKSVYFIQLAQDYAQMGNLKAVASGAIQPRVAQ